MVAYRSVKNGTVRDIRRHLVCWAIVASGAVFGQVVLHAQSPLKIRGPLPSELVNDLWMNATEGNLLTSEGWKETAGLYTDDSLLPRPLSFRVVSNAWAVWPAAVYGDTAEVTVDYTAAGEIDSSLRYTPPPKIPYMKTGILYRLILVPGYGIMYGPDGKTVISRKPSGTRGWQIDDHRGEPWTTVNTAVRYVLEMRNGTTDAAVRKNADRTLAKLLQLH